MRLKQPHCLGSQPVQPSLVKEKVLEAKARIDRNRSSVQKKKKKKKGGGGGEEVGAIKEEKVQVRGRIEVYTSSV